MLNMRATHQTGLGESMQPFALDQQILRDALLRVVGRDRVEVALFDGCPLRSFGLGPRDEWHEYEPPTPGTPVVVVTDLGIVRAVDTMGFATRPAVQRPRCRA